MSTILRITCLSSAASSSIARVRALPVIPYAMQNIRCFQQSGKKGGENPDSKEEKVKRAKDRARILGGLDNWAKYHQAKQEAEE
jgi:hypothetical protein